MSEQMNERVTQLEQWGSEIRELAEKANRTSGRMRFEDLLHIDELKALHAIAQARLNEFRAASGQERDLLEVAVENAWIELAAAFDRPHDRPIAPQPGRKTGTDPQER